MIDVDAPEWRAVLDSSAHDFYQRPGYVALCAGQERGRPCALLVTDDVRTMLLPLIVRRIPGGGFDATSPYGYPGPVGRGTDDPEFLKVALVAGLPVLRDANLVSAFVRLHPILNPWPPAGVGTVVQHGDTVSIDLTLPDEEIWAQTRYNHRRDIAHAARLGFIARMDPEWQRLAAFKHLYRQTMARRSAAAFYLFDDAYFDELLRALGDSVHLCVVEKDGVVAAAGMFVETNGIVQYHLSGTGASSHAVQPTKLMMHFVTGWARSRGNRVLHLGGGVGGGNDSLLQFKAGFSRRRHTFVTLRIVTDEGAYRRLVLARDPRSDPDARNGFFPLYRRT